MNPTAEVKSTTQGTSTAESEEPEVEVQPSMKNKKRKREDQANTQEGGQTKSAVPLSSKPTHVKVKVTQENEAEGRVTTALYAAKTGEKELEKNGSVPVQQKSLVSETTSSEQNQNHKPAQASKRRKTHLRSRSC